MASKDFLMSKLIGILAEAIKKSDTKFFFTNYKKQAESVMTALKKNGYEIVPKDASDAMIDHMLSDLPYGRMEKRQMAKEFYKLSILVGKAGRGKI